jgi:hypothetical protein
VTIRRQNRVVAAGRFFAALTLVLAACLVIKAGLTFAYTTDAAIYLPPDYATFRPPSAGGSYTDPLFGAVIKRISDSMHTLNAGGGVVTTIDNEYSTMSAFNSDNTRLLLNHSGYFALYDGAGNFIRDLFQYGIFASREPRWSRSDPTVFYYIVGNQLRRFNVESFTGGVVRTFAEYSSITGKGESDICFDGTHFVLAGDDLEIFVYDISADLKRPVFEAGRGGGFDQLYITPDDNVIVGWSAAGTDRSTGVELFDRDMNFIRQLTHAIGHMDVTRDSNGEEVLLWSNGADPLPLLPCAAGITKVRLWDGRQTCVWSGDWSLAVHVSASDNSGWFFVETYAPGDPIPPGPGWKLHTNEILQIKLDGTEVRRLAHHRSRPFNSYSYMPKVSINRGGTKLVYSSNFGLQSIGFPAEYSDAYLIDVAATTDAGAADPVNVTRVEDTNNAVTYTGGWGRSSNSMYSGGTAILTMDAGQRATFSFSGTKVNWIAYADQWSGIANVLLDGQLKAEIDLYSESSRPQFRAYGISGLAGGAHTLTVEVTGRRNASSAGSWVWVDAFDVFSGGAPVTITWTNPADIPYGGALNATQLNATAGFNGGPVSGYFVYTPAAGTVLNAGAGRLLQVDFLPSDPVRYRDASADVSINVLKAAQAITFGPIAARTYGVPPFTVSAAASSGLPVVFVASGPCAVSGNVVTLTGAGSCTITAQQPGNGNFLAATDVAQSFAIVV